MNIKVSDIFKAYGYEIAVSRRLAKKLGLEKGDTLDAQKEGDTLIVRKSPIKIIEVDELEEDDFD